VGHWATGINALVLTPKGWQSSCHPRERVESGSQNIFVFKPPKGATQCADQAPPRRSASVGNEECRPLPGALGNSRRHVPTGLHRWQADFRPFWGLKPARHESRKCVLPKLPQSQRVSSSWGRSVDFDRQALARATEHSTIGTKSLSSLTGLFGTPDVSRPVAWSHHASDCGACQQRLVVRVFQL
jgi:hypothetical protein